MNYTHKPMRGRNSDILEISVADKVRKFYFKPVEGGFKRVWSKPNPNYMMGSKIYKTLDDAVAEAVLQHDKFMRETVIVC